MNAENAVRAIMCRIDPDGFTESFEDRYDFDNRNHPSELAYSPLGNLLFVAFLGNDLIEVLDAHDRSVRATIRDAGTTPEALCFDPTAPVLYVHCFLDRSVTAFDVSGILDLTTSQAPPGADPDGREGAAGGGGPARQAPVLPGRGHPVER